MQMQDFILQKNKEGLYSSELINGKYQILESQFLAGNYYIYNLEKDCIEYRDNDNGITLFSSIQKCLDKLNNVKIVGKTKSVFKQRNINKSETAYSYMRELIGNMADSASNEQIYNLVIEKYPDSKYSVHYIKYLRKKMVG